MIELNFSFDFLSLGSLYTTPDLPFRFLPFFRFLYAPTALLLSIVVIIQEYFHVFILDDYATTLMINLPAVFLPVSSLSASRTPSAVKGYSL